jgi:Tol biopolymer transport system component
MFREAPVEQPVQFNVSYPSNVRPMSNGSDYQGGQISPNGLYVAFSGADSRTGKVGIYIRAIDATEATLVKGTEGGRYPFWSPTSRTIAFFAQGKLYRVDVDGSSLLLICDAPTGGWGGAWNSDDIIIAGVTDPGPLVSVSAKGGDTPTPLTKITLPENDHDWPQFLPDGRHFIYTAWSNTFTGTASTYVASLDNQDQKLLLKDLFDPIAYADPGFILFVRNGTLFAQPFNRGTLQLEGTQVQLASNAMGPISSSANGAISYTTSVDAFKSRLAWANRDGSDERSLTDTGYYRDPSVSPDGTRIAFARKDSFNGTLDVYVRDIRTGSERRLTFDPADDRSPIWSPDSKEIIFSAARTPHGLYRKNANGSGVERPIASERLPQIWSYQWSPEGYIMAYGDTAGSWDIWKVSLTDPKPTPVLTAPGLNEARGGVSPNGKWLAYDARETARFEVFLDTFPPSGSKLSVTTEGGAEPKWNQDGTELFYVSSATGALMSVPVTLTDPPTFGTHRQVHRGPLMWGWNSSHSFDLDQKTGRVLMTILEERGDLTVLLNWRALLRK